MIVQLKYFQNILNIVVILAPVCEFFPAICEQLPLTFKK